MNGGLFAWNNNRSRFVILIGTRPRYEGKIVKNASERGRVPMRMTNRDLLLRKAKKFGITHVTLASCRGDCKSPRQEPGHQSDGFPIQAPAPPLSNDTARAGEDSSRSSHDLSPLRHDNARLLHDTCPPADDKSPLPNDLSPRRDDAFRFTDDTSPSGHEKSRESAEAPPRLLPA